MLEINDRDKVKIMGGALNFNITVMVGMAISFIIGLIDGVINPNKCNI